MFAQLFITVAALAPIADHPYTKQSQNPTFDPAHAARFEIGDLRLIVGDHYPHGGSNRSSYTGIHHLSHKDRPSNVFCPYYAGMIGFRQAVAFKKLDDRSARLSLGDGPGRITETYRLVPPHYVDYEAAFTAKAPTGHWNNTSYMNGPADPGIFLVQPDGNWVRHSSPKHGTKASVAPAGFGPLPKVNKVKDSPYPHGGKGFHEGFDSIRFDPKYPLFYGRFDDFVLIFMIEPKWGDRLIPYMSPTGGGFSHEFNRNNPAWDYRFALKGLQPGQKVTIRSRLVYKPFAGNQDVLDEYRKWTKTLSRGNDRP